MNLISVSAFCKKKKLGVYSRAFALQVSRKATKNEIQRVRETPHHPFLYDEEDLNSLLKSAEPYNEGSLNLQPNNRASNDSEFVTIAEFFQKHPELSQFRNALTTSLSHYSVTGQIARLPKGISKYRYVYKYSDVVKIAEMKGYIATPLTKKKLGIFTRFFSLFGLN